MSKTTKTESKGVATADPLTLQREGQMWDTAQGLAAQPYQQYGKDRVAEFTGMQNQGFGMVPGAAAAGQGAVGQATGLAGAAGAYNPNVIDPSYMGAAATADPNVVGGGGQVGLNVAARDVTAQDAVGRIDQYMNPYTQSVVDASMSDMDLQRQRAIMQNQARATAGGSYGGSRAGVADAITNSEALRQSGGVAGQLRSAGFNTALGAATGDANRNLQAGMSNQQADIATGTANMQGGIANMNAGNVAAGLRANVGMFNAGALNNASQFNAGVDNSVAAQNAANGLTANAQHLGAAGALGQLGQTQQQMGLAGADAMLKAGGMQQGLNQAKLNTGYADWLDKQNDPYNKLGFLQGFRGTAGQVRNQTETETGSALGGIVGAAASIAGGPLGGVIGKYAGGLLGGGGGVPAAPSFLSPNALPNVDLGLGNGLRG